MSPNIKSIGVFKFRNIGDILLMTPALRVLRERFPQAKITVFVNDFTSDMLKGNTSIDEVIEFKRKHPHLLSRLAHEKEILGKITSAKFDLTLDLTSSDRTAWYSLLSGAHTRIAYPFKRNTFIARTFQHQAYTHVIEKLSNAHPQVTKDYHLLEQVFDFKTEFQKLELNLEPAEISWAKEQLVGKNKVVHIHAVARWLWKCWDSQKMAMIIDWLQSEKGCTVVYTSGPIDREQERAKEILSLCKIQPQTYIGNITLKQLAALSQQSTCFFGIDTAPMHMAAAVGVPVVALFGPTTENWEPWCEKKIILRHPCICNIQGGEFCDWKVTRACLSAISVEEAKKALEKFIL
jgi:heptosyltransferase-3